jgi:type VI secretion system protein ImpK
MAMPEVEGDAIYRASADLLTAIAQIGAPGWRPPTAPALRSEMTALLKAFVARGRESSIPDEEIAEARYALVACIDDRILRETGWSGRAEWVSNPLQLQFFREYTAGENFFARMERLVRRGAPLFALEVYYLCLGLGFVGARSPGAALRAPAESARAELLRAIGASPIAPHAVPRELIRAGQRPFPIARVAIIACAFVTVAGLVGLRLSLDSMTDRAAVEIASPRGATSPGGTGP